MSKDFVPYSSAPKLGTRSRHIHEKDGAFARAVEDLEEIDIAHGKSAIAMLGDKRSGKGRERGIELDLKS